MGDRPSKACEPESEEYEQDFKKRPGMPVPRFNRHLVFGRTHVSHTLSFAATLAIVKASNAPKRHAMKIAAQK